MWQWFLAHGDKLLASLTGLLLALQSSGAIHPSIAPAIAGALAILHTIVLPEPAAPASSLPQSKQTGNAGVAMLFTLLLVGCAAFGIKQPLSFDEKIASAYSAHTAVVTAATTALNAGTISIAQANQVLTMASNSRQLLDAAKAAESAGNTAGATNELALATAALTALQSYVNQQAGAH